MIPMPTSEQVKSATADELNLWLAVFVMETIPPETEPEDLDRQALAHYADSWEGLGLLATKMDTVYEIRHHPRTASPKCCVLLDLYGAHVAVGEDDFPPTAFARATLLHRIAG